MFGFKLTCPECQQPITPKTVKNVLSFRLHKFLMPIRIKSELFI